MTDALNADIIFFPGENPDALKQSFIEQWAIHGNRFPVIEIGQYVFKGLKDAYTRGGQAAQVWAADLDVLNRVRDMRLRGRERPVIDEDELIARALSIADDTNAKDRDRIEALKVIVDIKGYRKQPTITLTKQPSLIDVLPTIEFARYAD